MADRPGEAAPAKINLALHILGKRADGYHDLDSLVVFAAIGDRVAIAPGSGLALAVDGPFAEAVRTVPPKDNLVLRAAAAIAAAAGRSADLSFALTKNLPVASGLGGGSADAAATLRLLDRAWRLRWGEERLGAVAASLGADVPMCLWSRPLRATGKGERLAAASAMPPLPMVLAFPGHGVSTAAAFARLGPAGDGPLPAMPARFASVQDVAGWLGQTRNGLEAAAITLTPAVAEVLHALTSTRDCLLARMSGSGSCCFALYPSEGTAKAAAAALARPGWWVTATTTGGSD